MLIMTVSPAKPAEPIEIPLRGVWIRGPPETTFYVGPGPQLKGHIWGSCFGMTRLARGRYVRPYFYGAAAMRPLPASLL